MTQRDKQREASRLVEFTNSPAVEVALAIGFQQLAGLGTVELARLWQERFSRAFPKVQEQPRVEMAIEQFGLPTPGPVFKFQLLETPLVPRLWFLNSDESQLVQVQNNWFARNWRQQASGPEYPHYPNVRGLFEADLSGIIEHVRKSRLGVFKPIQCELTYINHIPFEGSAPAHLRDVLRFFAQRSPIGPLGEPESIRTGVQWIIAADGEPIGRAAHDGRARHSSNR